MMMMITIFAFFISKIDMNTLQISINLSNRQLEKRPYLKITNAERLDKPLQSFKVITNGRCAATCTATPECASYNLRMINDKIYKAVCELNGHSGSPPNLTSNKVDYYEITVPVDGGPGTWSAWGACSTTCGDGDQTRIRACDNPFPAYCGSQCNSSDLTDMRSCNESKCPDKPGPPGLPFVFVLDDIANVTWTPPHDDGGAIITNYNIEMRRSDNYNNTWLHVNMNICIPGNSYLVRSLTEDVEYEFRIVAENEAGTGEPSQQSVKFTFVRPNVVMRIPSPIWSPIWDLTVTSLGNIVTTSTQHSTSKIYNRTLQLIKDLNKKFICVTKTSDGQLAFTTNPFSNIIHFYTENGSPIRTITCPSDIRLNGIASLSAGELVVTDGYTNGVYIVDSSNGNTTQISTSDDMFQSPTYLAVDIRNHIIVSDYHRHLIKVINREGLEIIHYGSGEGQLMGPLGVCTDINGFIILGELGNRVQLLTPNATFHSLLLTVADGVSSPYAVHVNEVGELLVGDFGGQLFVVNYRD